LFFRLNSHLLISAQALH